MKRWRTSRRLESNGHFHINFDLIDEAGRDFGGHVRPVLPCLSTSWSFEGDAQARKNECVCVRDLFCLFFCTWACVCPPRLKWPMKTSLASFRCLFSLFLSHSGIYDFITTDMQLCYLISLFNVWVLLSLSLCLFDLIFGFLIDVDAVERFLWEIYSRVIHFVWRCVALFIRVAFYGRHRHGRHRHRRHRHGRHRHRRHRRCRGRWRRARSTFYRTRGHNNL